MTNLLSEENLYCDMFNKGETRFQLLDRITKLFPKAKIILGVRDKKKLLISWYKQYVAVGGTLKFDDFIEKVMNIENLNYETYIDRLHDFYGEQNVLIYRFKNLLKDRQKTLEKICRFIGCSVPNYRVYKRNIGYGKNQIKASLVLNSFYKNQLNDRGLPYPKNLFLPHRYIFQSRVFSWYPRNKVELDDLVKHNSTKKKLENILS